METVNTQDESVISRLMKADKNWFNDLTDDQKFELMWDWSLWARPKQIAPEGAWRVW